MSAFRVLLILLAGTLLLSAAESSTSRGAFAFASSGRTYSGIRRQLEKSEEEFFSLTRFPESQVPPVHVVIAGRNARPALAVDALEGGVPSITLVIPSGHDDPETPPLVAAALLLREHYGMTAPVPGSRIPRHPDWVLHGLGFLIAGEEPGGKTGNTPSEVPELAAFLTERVPDPDSVTLRRNYDITAGELVRTGLSDDAGRASFRSWVGSHDPAVADSSPPPWIAGWEMQSLERRWTLALQASRRGEGSAPASIEGAEESLARYETLLSQYKGADSSLAGLREERGGGFRLDELSGKLAALRLRANPLAAPLLDDTISLVRQIPRLPPAAIRNREQALANEAAAVRLRARGIADYMNWYEAARLEKPSGLFDAYLEAPPAPVRKGPVGLHLDAVEQRGW